MSWEGYYQCLCKKGHLQIDNAEYQDAPTICEFKDCKEKIVWVNQVDTTNGSYDTDKNGKQRRIDGCVTLKINKKHTCDKCKSTLEVTYKIPKRKKK